jgi:hypothetical protein
MNSAMFLAAQRATRRSGKKMCRGKTAEWDFKKPSDEKSFLGKTN